MAGVEDQHGANAVPIDLVTVLKDAPPRIIKPKMSIRTLQMMQHREVRRLIAFLFAGGVSAAVTITVTALLDRFTAWPFVLAAACGTEVGILVNFAVNDLISFRDLARSRHVVLRALRFHVTCAIGQSVILALSVLLHDTWHWWSVAAQAVPIVLVTGLNFTLHRFWTYRTTLAMPSTS